MSQIYVFYAFCLSGTLKKFNFKSNDSEPLVTDGEARVPGVVLVNTDYYENTGVPSTPPSQSTPAWTPRAPSTENQSHRNASKCEVVEQECLCVCHKGCSLQMEWNAHRSRGKSHASRKPHAVAVL